MRRARSRRAPNPSCSTSARASATGARPSRTTARSRAHALVTHLHFDHVQGLPFLAPADRPGARLDIYAPAQDDESLAEAFEGFIRPPYFPIRWSDLRGDYRFHEVSDTDVVVGDAKVTRPHRPARRPHQRLPRRARRRHRRLRERPPDAASTAAHEVPAGCSSWPTASTCSSTTRSTRPRSSPRRRTGATARSSSPCTSRVEAGAKRLALFHHDPDARRRRRRPDARRGPAAVPAGADLEVLAASRGPDRHPRRPAARPLRSQYGGLSREACGVGHDRDRPHGVPADPRHLPDRRRDHQRRRRRRARSALAIGSFTSVSLDPPLVGFLPGKGSTTWPKIEADRIVLREHPRRRPADGVPGLRRQGRRQVRRRSRGAPSAPARRSSTACSSWIDCTLESVAEAGDHWWVLGPHRRRWRVERDDVGAAAVLPRQPTATSPVFPRRRALPPTTE